MREVGPGVVVKEMESFEQVFWTNIALFEAPRTKWHAATVAHTNTQGVGTLLIYFGRHGRQCTSCIFKICDLMLF